jgi:O-antigen/teichoic acid export membrane protein
MKDFIRKIISNNLAINSSIVFAGSMVSNVGSYLYHLVVGRILGPSGYGELSSLISLLYIFGVPTIVLQTVLVKYFSTCKASQSPGQAAYLFKKMTKTLLLILMPLFAVLCACSPFIADFLNISGSRVVIWVLLIFVISTLTAVNTSVLQGFQLFIWYALLTAGGSIVKLVVSIPFAYQGVEMTMIASFLIVAIFYIVYFVPMRFIFAVSDKRMDLTKKDVMKYTIPTFFTLLGMTALYSIDIVLVKHYVSAIDAGIYSSVAVLGKVIFYASSAIGTVLFPVLAERHAKGKDTFSIVRLSVLLVAGLSLFVTIIYAAFPKEVVHLLFGPSFDEASTYLGVFAVFITLYSIVNILVLACLAIERMYVYIFTCIASMLQILLIMFFHTSLLEVIYINIGITGLLCKSVGAYYWYGKNKYYHSGI